jgi:hypothetical protein
MARDATQSAWWRTVGLGALASAGTGVSAASLGGKAAPGNRDRLGPPRWSLVLAGVPWLLKVQSIQCKWRRRGRGGRWRWVCVNKPLTAAAACAHVPSRASLCYRVED